MTQVRQQKSAFLHIVHARPVIHSACLAVTLSCALSLQRVSDAMESLSLKYPLHEGKGKSWTLNSWLQGLGKLGGGGSGGKGEEMKNIVFRLAKQLLESTEHGIDLFYKLG